MKGEGGNRYGGKKGGPRMHFADAKKHGGRLFKEICRCMVKTETLLIGREGEKKKHHTSSSPQREKKKREVVMGGEKGGGGGGGGKEKSGTKRDHSSENEGLAALKRKGVFRKVFIPDQKGGKRETDEAMESDQRGPGKSDTAPGIGVSRKKKKRRREEKPMAGGGGKGEFVGGLESQRIQMTKLGERTERA